MHSTTKPLQKLATLALVTAILLMAIALSGCGQKGGLYLPEEEVEQPSKEQQEKKKKAPQSDSATDTDAQPSEVGK